MTGLVQKLDEAAKRHAEGEREEEGREEGKREGEEREGEREEAECCPDQTTLAS